jgi:hypothetical protein
MDASGDANYVDTGPGLVTDAWRPMDSATPPLDAPGTDVGPLDSGLPAPGVIVDGNPNDVFWSSAATPTSPSIPAIAPFLGETLSGLRLARDATYLYVAIEAAIASGDAVVMFFDTDPTGGVLLTPAGITGVTGRLDSTMAIPMVPGAGFQPEWGWGTDLMPIAPRVGDADIGWRQLFSPGPFTALAPSGTISACSMTACETVIPLAALGATATSTIQVVVRLGRASAMAWSNQTYSYVDQGDPTSITAVETVPTYP